jgi:MFS family permease
MSASLYWVSPTNVTGMVLNTVLWSLTYAPTIPLVWAMFADVADYSEWKTGRRFTGIIFATIGFALKSGLALGSSSLLWIMAGFYHYDPKVPATPEVLEGYRACSGLVVGILFALCTILLAIYQIDKALTLRIADELATRRRTAA